MASFKTKKDANVEDLLKELPGVEVDDDGSITINGKSVNKILVNGKSFFGNDPTITTRSLTKELIEKIQITDTKSIAEAFSGEKGDTENKTINLTIKKENNKGVFGRVSAGGGTDKRYEHAGMVNFFDNDRHLSVLAGGNNINSSGFSFGEIGKIFGGAGNNSGGSFSGGQGITTSNIVGLNYADELGKNNDFSGDYSYSGSNSKNATTSERENFLPNSRYYTSATSNSLNDTDSHGANMAFDIKLDSTLMINVRPSFRFSDAMNTYERHEASRDENQVLTNQSETASLVQNSGKNFGNNINLTKRFGGKGAFLRVNLNNNINVSNSEDFLNSETNIYGSDPNDMVRKQFTDGEMNSNSLNMGVTYRLPLQERKWFLDFKYNFNSNKRHNITSTFDFDQSTQSYDDFNMLLSSDFTNNNLKHSPKIKLVHNTDKMTFRLGSGYTVRTIENADRLRPELSLERNFEFLELDTDLNYRFSSKASVNLKYDYKNDLPGIAQLQPFEDVSNPLTTITGNPNLKPSKIHSMNFGFNNFDYQRRTGFYIWANANLTQDNVVSKTIVDENFVRNTTYANVNGNYATSLGSNWSKDFKLDSVHTVKVRLGLSGSLNQQVNFNNGVELAALSTRLNPNLELTYRWNNIFELRPNYRLSFTNTHYDLDKLDDQEFVSHRLGINTATFFPKRLEWRNDINFMYNPSVAKGFQKSSWFWNATMTYSVLKDNGTVALKIYDLLNQNTNAQRTTTDNYIQDSESTVLEQYFMVGFSWKFNNNEPTAQSSSGRGSRRMMTM